MSRRRTHAKLKAIAQPYYPPVTRARAKRSQLAANMLPEKECSAAFANTDPVLEQSTAVTEIVEAADPAEDLSVSHDGIVAQGNHYCVKRNKLDLVSFDVWRSVLLQMLSVRAIIRLCQASRHFHRFFMNEETFRFLTENRYKISPNLHMNISYKAICRTLYTAVSLAHLKWNDWFFLRWVYKDFTQDIASRINNYLYCLPVLSQIMQNDPEQYEPWKPKLILLPGFNMPPFVRAREAKKMFPNLSLNEISKRYTGPFDVVGQYSTGSLKQMELIRYGSVEVYQAALIKMLFLETQEFGKYLVYHHRCNKFRDVVNCLHKVTTVAQAMTLLPCLGGDREALPPFLRITIDGPQLTWRAPSVAVKICKIHSAVKSYIEERLLMDIDDYCGACSDYHKRHCHVNGRLRTQKALFRGFGKYLAFQYPDYKVWTKYELLEAMTEYGSTLGV
eukprot:scpid58915/ scgid19381/ 